MLIVNFNSRFWSFPLVIQYQVGISLGKKLLYVYCEMTREYFEILPAHSVLNEKKCRKHYLVKNVPVSCGHYMDLSEHQCLVVFPLLVYSLKISTTISCLLGCFSKDTLKKNKMSTPPHNWGVPRKIISRRRG